MSKVYLHETIDIILHGRAAYMNHMADFLPTARKNKGMLGVGIWGTIGSTDRWPQVVNLWELDGWHGLARSLDHETAPASLEDPAVDRFWEEAAQFRSGGFDRVLLPAPWSPTLQQLIDGKVRGHIYHHFLISCSPGGAPRVIETIGEHLVQLRSFEVQLVGVYETAQVNRSEVVAIFALPSWERWADIQSEWVDGALEAFRCDLAAVSLDWKSKVLRPFPRSPIDAGVIA